MTKEYKTPDTYCPTISLSDFAMKIDGIKDGSYPAECHVIIKDGYARIVGDLKVNFTDVDVLKELYK